MRIYFHLMKSCVTLFHSETIVVNVLYLMVFAYKVFINFYSNVCQNSILLLKINSSSNSPYLQPLSTSSKLSQPEYILIKHIEHSFCNFLKLKYIFKLGRESELLVVSIFACFDCLKVLTFFLSF